MRVAVQAQEPDGALLPVEHDERDRICARRPDRDRRLDRPGGFTKRRALHEAQHLDELPRPKRAEIGLEAPPQQREADGQLPALERPGQVVTWVIGGVLFAPTRGGGWRRALAPEEIEICSIPPETITS